MRNTPPRCLIMAGPNGAGKSTHAAAIVSGLHGIDRYINPDIIASGLGGFRKANANFDAGRIALEEVDKSIDAREDFAFETTLSGRRWSKLLDTLDAAGFVCIIHYLWLPTVELSISRVEQRVRSGGHDIPEGDLRRRLSASVKNFVKIFKPRADEWFVYDSSTFPTIAKIAQSAGEKEPIVFDQMRWTRFIASSSSSSVRETAPTLYGATSPVRSPHMSIESTALNGLRRVVTADDVVEASRGAIRRALAIQRALGVGAAVMRDGKVVIIPPHELPLTATDDPYVE